MKECKVCGRYTYTEEHHVIFGRANRKLSEKYGLKVDLCAFCHRDGKHGVHHNRELDLKLKREFQEKFEAKYSRDKWMEVFGRNYIL